MINEDFLGYGIVKAKIIDIKVVKARTNDSKKVEFVLEGDSTGRILGKTGRATTHYMSKMYQYKIFANQIKEISRELNVLDIVDKIKGDGIEDYVCKIKKHLSDQYLWWNIGAEWYSKDKFTLTLPRGNFVRAVNKIDENTAIIKDRIVVSISGLPGYIGLHWEESNNENYKKWMANGSPDNGFYFPTNRKSGN